MQYESFAKPEHHFFVDFLILCALNSTSTKY